MSQSSNDRLQFSINESVWLRDDAPAEEILSMALEPDITVEENWNDVSIKGFLRLTGEYRPAQVSGTDAGTESAAPFRTIDEIIDTGNGTDTLEHRFPIDITIPADRVPDLENLFVVIDSFDYELTEHRHIQLQADIAITGLINKNSEDRTEKPKEAPVVEKPEEVPVKKEKATKPSKPLKKPVTEKAEQKSDQAEKKPAKNAEKTEQGKSAAPKNGKEKQTEAETKGKSIKKEEKSAKSKETKKATKSDPKSKRTLGDGLPIAGADLSEEVFEEMPTDHLNREEADDFQYEAFRKPSDELPDDSTPHIAFSGQFSDRSEGVQATHQQPAPVPEQDQASQPAGEPGTEQPEGNEEKKSPDATSLYLTKVLAGNDEEQKTRLKICIVQTGDSLETISERYHVPVTTLLRKNDLTSAEVEPGELLYIPKSTKAVQDDR
ncbi:LysM peptidoglycan-binding domain-containing protein [Sporolactobacillus sp. CPB3-1]|uniref:LysM peptidoglycan-binding domain-containing protein n=1 Tax=Sporolactobacillus mangiferae TaxID=2940498 RepID=A0ABT0M7B3_9BACL|nr:LysM peptidoglycan-binding domain-containing protein [Sporolactobacillus mangiferae]MCL1630523.1 LysM peptidoglycan-binding domain-containing protein [Sporolactobacillus mangiferae]